MRQTFQQIWSLNELVSDLFIFLQGQDGVCDVMAAVNTYACGQMYFTCGILMPVKASAQPCLSCWTTVNQLKYIQK